jgi:hypothetical protein
MHSQSLRQNTSKSYVVVRPRAAMTPIRPGSSVRHTGSPSAHSPAFGVTESFIASLLVRLQAVSTVDRDERGVKDVTNAEVAARFSEWPAGL